MRIEDARIEVMDRVSKICGYTITEKDLSPAARQSVNSLATIFRQLVMTKQLLMVEQKEYDHLSSRVARAVSGSDHIGYSKHIAQVGQLQKDLDGKIHEAAEKIGQELQSKWASPASGVLSQQPEISHVMLEPLKCKNCGASLSNPSSSTIKCRYCGTEFAISEYLEQVGSIIRNGQNPLK